MSIRIRHPGAVVGATAILLATLSSIIGCGATPDASEGATATQSDALVSRGPPSCVLTNTCPCGAAGEPACTSGARCVTGATDVGGSCLACSSLQPTASVRTQTVYDPDTDQQAVVTWSTTPGASGVVVTLQDQTNPAIEETRDVFGASGTTTFAGLGLGSNYTVNVTAFGASSNYCPPGWTSQAFAFQNQCVTYVTPERKPANGQGWANLKICKDGSWTYWGEVDNTGAFGESYAMSMNLQWQDSTGAYPLNFLQTGQVAGWADSSGSRTSTFSQSGTSTLIALDWGAVTSAPEHDDLFVDTNIANAVGDVLLWSSGVVGVVVGGVCCQKGTISNTNGGLRCDC